MPLGLEKAVLDFFAALSALFIYVPILGVGFLLVLTLFAGVAVASAPKSKRSEVSIRVLEVIARAKHPPNR